MGWVRLQGALGANEVEAPELGGAVGAREMVSKDGARHDQCDGVRDGELGLRWVRR